MSDTRQSLSDLAELTTAETPAAEAPEAAAPAEPRGGPPAPLREQQLDKQGRAK